MTYYTPKSRKQWNWYEPNIRTGAENDTCSLFCLYFLLHLSKNYEISV